MPNSCEKRRGPCLHRSEVFGQSINCRPTGWCASKWCSLETTRANSFSCSADRSIDRLIDCQISDFDVRSFDWLIDWLSFLSFFWPTIWLLTLRCVIFFRLEWEKIQNSPDPERALKRYNDFNGPWVKPPKEYLELFKLERTFNEYHNKEPLTQWHEQPQQWSTWMKEFDWLQYEKGSLQPTYFGFSRFRKEWLFDWLIDWLIDFVDAELLPVQLMCLAVVRTWFFGVLVCELQCAYSLRKKTENKYLQWGN